jgi:hypothetical protein
MAGSASDYLENKILDHVVGKTSFTMPTAYVALCLAEPGEANSGAGISEVADANGYARVSTAGGDWNAASGGASDNANAITFPQATGSWGTVTHFAIMTSPVRGEGYMLLWGDLTSPKPIDNGDTAEFAAGDLDLTCT